MASLKERYFKEIVPAMQQRFGYRNVMEAPRLTKVTINSGTGKALGDEKYLDTVVSTLTRISGQKPVLTKARQSISAFKIRKGMTVGVMVTLRGRRMYDFLDRLVNVTLPRIRDFQGIAEKSVDDRGNLTIGFKENIAFPEIRSDEVDRIHGLEVVISTTAGSRDVGRELFSLIGIPFKKK